MRLHKGKKGEKKNYERSCSSQNTPAKVWKTNLHFAFRFLQPEKKAEMKPQRFHVGILNKPKQTFNPDTLKITISQIYA